MPGQNDFSDTWSANSQYFWPDKTEFTYVVLSAHLGGVKRKICSINNTLYFQYVVKDYI